MDTREEILKKEESPSTILAEVTFRSAPPQFEVGDIVKLNWRTENDIVKIIRGPSPTILFVVEVWFVDNTGREGWTGTAKSLTLLSPATPLCKELDGISVGDVIRDKDGQYREVVLINPSRYNPYGVYFSLGVKWYEKEDIVQVFKFP